MILEIHDSRVILFCFPTSAPIKHDLHLRRDGGICINTIYSLAVQDFPSQNASNGLSLAWTKTASEEDRDRQSDDGR